MWVLQMVFSAELGCNVVMVGDEEKSCSSIRREKARAFVGCRGKGGCVGRCGIQSANKQGVPKLKAEDRLGKFKQVRLRTVRLRTDRILNCSIVFPEE